MGDTGKGLLLLDLALKVASHTSRSTAFGPSVSEQGTVVLFSAEDDAGELQRRLDSLDPHRMRNESGTRLLIVPLPNAGGPFSLVEQLPGKRPIISSEFDHIRKQLLALKDLKLIIFDPLASFVHVDVNADPAMGAFTTGILAHLASETGAAVIVAHHMRKPASSGKPICTPEQARDAIRGTTALVDGVRCVYALWPASEEETIAVCKALETQKKRNTVYCGAVVKANGPVDRDIRTYYRSDVGLLEDLTCRMKSTILPDTSLATLLRDAIAYSAREGHPFTHTGESGVYKQSHRLPSSFHHLSRNKIEKMVQNLLNEKRIVKGKAKGSKDDKWLDIPIGPFARGVGKFQLGAEPNPDRITG